MCWWEVASLHTRIWYIYAQIWHVHRHVWPCTCMHTYLLQHELVTLSCIFKHTHTLSHLRKNKLCACENTSVSVYGCFVREIFGVRNLPVACVDILVFFLQLTWYSSISVNVFGLGIWSTIVLFFYDFSCIVIGCSLADCELMLQWAARWPVFVCVYIVGRKKTEWEGGFTG